MSTAPGTLDRLRVALGRFSGRRTRSPTLDRALLVGAGLVFVTATVLAARALPEPPELHWLPIAVLAGIAVPAASLANALEYAVAARIEGHRVPLGEAVEVSVLSSAANLLPLPGAALVRVGALHKRGSSYRRALSVTVVVGGAWLATSLVLAAAILAANRSGGTDGAVVALVGVAGVTGLGLTMAGVAALAPPGAAVRLGAALLGAEIAAVAVAALRYVLVLEGLGLAGSVAQSVALTVAAVVASAVGFVPGGLGIREALAGAIATVVGLPAAIGVLATGVDRLVGLPVLGVLAIGFALRGRTAGAPEPAP